ncbi:MAG: TusE/DsrC/DsvC family sulfur relay protein [Halieaceae bacterium]|jgi:tRNA 2-thiouridine synthesizing protein E|nr:TusE/DsrC/DsvC family sulfur relay protein [Halieaceae bacterium]
MSETLPELTEEGFLCEVDDWNEDVARALARREGIELEDAHWEILFLLRDYWHDYDSSPAMRALVKYVRLRLGDDKAKSIYLLRLFPGSPAKIGSRIAGLPKPANCL